MRMVRKFRGKNYGMVAFSFNKRKAEAVARRLKADGHTVKIWKWAASADQKKYLKAKKYQYGVYVAQKGLKSTGMMRGPAWV